MGSVKTSTVILGIDPGLRVTGYGLINVTGSTSRYLDSGCIRTQGKKLQDRLRQLYQAVDTLMQQFRPDQIAIEDVFVNKNVNSALKLGHARAAAMIAAGLYDLPISEYATRLVKQAVVGYGHATKDQVQTMVKKLLALTATPQADAADALAVALCHVHSQYRLNVLASTA